MRPPCGEGECGRVAEDVCALPAEGEGRLGETQVEADLHAEVEAGGGREGGCEGCAGLGGPGGITFGG